MSLPTTEGEKALTLAIAKVVGYIISSENAHLIQIKAVQDLVDLINATGIETTITPNKDGSKRIDIVIPTNEITITTTKMQQNARIAHVSRVYEDAKKAVHMEDSRKLAQGLIELRDIACEAIKGFK